MTRQNREPLRVAEAGARPAYASPGEPLQATSWSIVRAAADPSDPGRSREALLELAARYRAPVRAFILHSGYSEPEADALTARFLLDLERPGALQAAARVERFRIWLLDAVRDFLLTVDEEEVIEPGLAPSRAESSLAPERVEAPSPEPQGADRPPPFAELFGQRSPCSRCNSPNDELDADGVCATCLETRFDRYEDLERIGFGGEAIVYRAWDPRDERHVALKVLKLEHLTSPEVVERFLSAVELAGKLDHPNILRVHERGMLGGRPFYTMPLITGDNLAQARRQERFRDPEQAARLMIEIARAVQHAHQHGVLHRDLSPANVLLDDDGKPYVSDFMARRIGQGGDPSIVGKLNYMAPEQARGKGGTVEADVYGLGAIFFELLTGRPPVSATSFDELRERQANGVAPSARALAPNVSRDLDAVCSAALHPEPALRHRSAALFADSLERVLEKHPPLWPLATRRRRLALWGARQPLLAIGALLGAVLLVVADIALVRSVGSEERELETTSLHDNAALASAQARAVLALFEKYAAQTARAAVDEGVREFLEQGETAELAPALIQAHERMPSFDSISLFSPDGHILARHPRPEPGFIGKEFTFRHYYECARVLAARRAQLGTAVDSAAVEPEVCVSPAYRGESSKGIEFSFAAPVHAADGRWLGFVLANKHARHTLDEIDIGDAYRSGQTTALFGRRGVDRGSPPRDPAPAGELTAVAHPELFGTEEHALDHTLSARLVERFGEEGAPGQQLRPVRERPYEDSDYVDPVTGDRRLAGFAPVGATGFVVVVSTPRERALGTSQRHVEALWKYAGLLNLGFLILSVVAIGSSLRDNPRATGASRRRG